MQPEPIAAAPVEDDLRADRSMLILQYAIALLAASAAGLLAFLH
jgi:hypothetical protein